MRILIWLMCWRRIADRIWPCNDDRIWKQTEGGEINAEYKACKDRKSKAEGLTSAERQEQALLRSEYLEAVRRNLKGQLDNIDIVNKDGSVENLGKKYEERYGKKGN